VKRLAGVGASVAAVLLAAALLVPWPALGARVLAALVDARGAEFAVRIERSVALTTPDGVRLVADVYHPQPAGQWPTILVRLPYDHTFRTRAFASSVGHLWAARGYTVVIQGTRGRYESGGRHRPFLDERGDGIATLAWIARQAWYDGRIGTWGGSYFGYTQWAIADQRGPGPTALMIQLASTDVYGTLYPGGAFALASALYWALRSRGDRDDPPTAAAIARGADGVSLIEADDRAGTDVPAFNEWVTHPRRDAYWKAVDGERRAARLTAPVHLMGGWYDPFLPTQLADYVTIRRETAPEISAATRLVIGPWGHATAVTLPGGRRGSDYRLASLAPTLAWFDRHLARRPAGPDPAPVRLFVMGANVWREEGEWPLARAREAAFYLQSRGHANSAAGDGVLHLTPPMGAERPDTFVYDPARPVPTAGGALLGPGAGSALQAEIERRDDVLVYTSEPLPRPLEITGPVTAVLHLATTAPHTDVTAKLVDVHPDGAAWSVTDGIARQAFSPGVHQIRVDLWPTSMRFDRGHRLRLQISSSNVPRFDRNPNTGADIATERRLVVARQTVHHGVTTPSRLLLPVVDGAP